jgi:hypothetical protein
MGTPLCTTIGIAHPHIEEDFLGPLMASGQARSHAFDVETATQIATQLFGIGWQLCWNSTSDSRNLGYYGSCAYGAFDTDAEKLGQARPNRRFVR